MKPKNTTTVQQLNTPPEWCDTGCTYFPTCAKNYQAACDRVKELSAEPVNGEFLDDTFLHLLNTAIQKKCEAKEVSDYILASKELLLAAETPQTELHIITNELDNYDKTVLASMAISANILGKRQDGEAPYQPSSKGVKYIYYCPSECVRSFEKFKERISSFARRDLQSRMEVDGWLRRNFSRRNRLIKKLMPLDEKSPEDFVSNLFNVNKDLRSELVELCKSSPLFADNSFRIKKGIENWLQGSENSVAQRNAKELNDFLCAIWEKVKRENFKIYKRDITFEYVYNCIHSLYLLSEWQLGTLALPNEERERIFQYIFYDVAHDDLDWDGIKDQFENWLAPNDNDECGELQVDSSIIKGAIENNLVLMEVKSSIPLSYSWCFFISPNEQQDAIAWYVTAEKNSNGSLSSDNTVFMYKTQDLSEMKLYIKGYATLINCNPHIKAKLEEIKSLILKYIKEDE